MSFKEKYEEESLSSKTVVAFTSALLVLQSWLWSRGELELVDTRTVSIPIAVFIAISAILFGVSVFLAAGTVIPRHSPEWLLNLRTYAIHTANFLSRGLDLMVLVGYTVSWISAWASIKQDPASGNWLSDIVLWAGFGFFIFIGIWVIRREISCMLRKLLNELRLIRQRIRPGLDITARFARRMAGVKVGRGPGCGSGDEVTPSGGVQ